MPLVDDHTEANTPGVRLVKAKLAHAIPNELLCPMRKELTSQQPTAPECHWSADMKGPFIHVVFNFQSWEMFEFASPPPEIEGVPAIDAGENIKLYFMDAVGREVMSALKTQRSHCERLVGKVATGIAEANVETFNGCLEEGQTPAFYLLHMLLAEKVLGREVDFSDFMRRVVQSEMVVLLARDMDEC